MSECDVTNSGHQKHMATIYHWMNPPWEFSAYATAQDKSCKEIINEQDKEKFKQDFLKMIRI